MEVSLRIDGGSRGNPGPAAGGIQLITKSQDQGQRPEERLYGFFLGNQLTNNQAEYLALILGLRLVLKLFEHKQIELLTVWTDSELLAKQFKGEYKVKNSSLKRLHKEVKDLVEKLTVVKLGHISREKNKQADRMVNEILDLHVRTKDLFTPASA